MACCDDKGKLELAQKIIELMNQNLICCTSCVTNGCCCQESSEQKKEESQDCPCC